jgi:hypothetical protein
VPLLDAAGNDGPSDDGDGDDSEVGHHRSTSRNTWPFCGPVIVSNTFVIMSTSCWLKKGCSA